MTTRIMRFLLDRTARISEDALYIALAVIVAISALVFLGQRISSVLQRIASAM